MTDPDEAEAMRLMLEEGVTIEEIACLWDAPGPWGWEKDTWTATPWSTECAQTSSGASSIPATTEPECLTGSLLKRP